VVGQEEEVDLPSLVEVVGQEEGVDLRTKEQGEAAGQEGKDLQMKEQGEEGLLQKGEGVERHRDQEEGEGVHHLGKGEAGVRLHGWRGVGEARLRG